MTKQKVCAYCRVSTKDKEQLTSFENQKAYFQREFGDNENFELICLYADCGRTGTSLNRPAFDRMIVDAGIDKTKIDGDLFSIVGKPKFTRIIVKNTSRFARNVSADMLIKTLTKNGVYIDFVDTNLSTERAADIMTLQVLQVLDENESRDKSRKVLFGLEESVKRGNILAHGNLYGYKYHPRPENRLEAIEEEAEVVRLLFDLYANKRMGCKRIRDYLSQRQIFNRKGNPFNENTLLGMIKNEVYTGHGVRQKYSGGVIFEKHTVKETGNPVVFETDKIDPIISVELYQKAQSVLDSKVIRHVLKGRNDGKTDFAQKIVCGCCGTFYSCTGNRVTDKARGKVRVYSCRHKLTKHYDDQGNRVFLCENPNITEDKLNSMLNGISYNLLIYFHIGAGIKELNRIVKILEGRIDNQSAEETKELTVDLLKIKKRKDKLLDLYLDSSFSKEHLDERMEPLNKEEQALQAKIKALSKSNDEIHQDIAEVNETLTYLREQYKMIDQHLKNGTLADTITREEMLEGLECFVVNPDGSLTVELKAYKEIEQLLDKHSHFFNEIERERKAG